ncbi:MAG: type II toxin-antitoxin system VapC family toxin [Pirellulales bacterium]
MPDYFYDTSALVKRYHTELGTAEVDLLFADPTATHSTSRLGAVELLSAFSIKARMGTITAASTQAMRARFQNDQAGHIIRILRMRGKHYRNSEALLLRYGLQLGLRTLDALQLAVAVELRRQGRITHIVASDTNFCSVAQAEGFVVINPEQP